MGEQCNGEAAFPLISVVIPTYNHAHFLKDALISVQSQTFENWEVIIIDNHSTDDTCEMVRSFKEKRFKLVSFKNEGVIAASRNLGIQLAQGRWVAFLDSDDCWYPEKLSKCLALSEFEQIDMIAHGMDFSRDGELWRNYSLSWKSNDSYEELLYGGNKFITSSVMVSKGLLNRVGAFCDDKELITVEDYDLWLRISAVGKILMVPDILGLYRWHSDGMSKKVAKHLIAELALLEKHFSVLALRDTKGNLKEKRTARAYYTAARMSLLDNQWRDVIMYCFQGIRVYPWSIRHYLLLGLLLGQMILPRKLLLKRWV